LRLSLLYPSHHPNARLCDLEHTASGFWIVDLRRHRTCSSCPYMLFTSPASFEKAGHDWSRVATLPAAGTGPFRLTKVLPQEMRTLRASMAIGTRATRPSSTPVPDPGGEQPACRVALRPGRLDRGAAARRHSLAQGGGLLDHHQLLSACFGHGRYRDCGQGNFCCSDVFFR
jgi:hypothetical protein